jgi:hypothetical protein
MRYVNKAASRTTKKMMMYVSGTRVAFGATFAWFFSAIFFPPLFPVDLPAGTLACLTAILVEEGLVFLQERAGLYTMDPL